MTTLIGLCTANRSATLSCVTELSMTTPESTPRSGISRPFGPPGPSSIPTGAAAAIRVLTAGLLLFFMAMAAKGLRQAWVFDGDTDMQARVAECESFRQGVYPTRPIETDVPAGMKVPYTVYPPYALPMFAVFFEPFGKIQGRIVIELLSLASLVAIAAYGRRLLANWGSAAAGLGAVAALAISGNGNAIALGQFSILCAGALLMQIISLERGRPLAAGAWWAVAMLKPQIGLAFAGLFLVRREWRGLAVGLAILVGLSLAACWWTEVSPVAVIQYWIFQANMRFAAATSMPGRIAESLGLHHRIFHLAAALLLLVVPLMLPKKGSVVIRADPLFLGGLAAILGGTVLYHLFYDNVMMFPLLFVGLSAAARRPTPGRLAIAAMLGLSLWTPQQIIGVLPLAWLVRPAAWIACSMSLLAAAQRVSVEDLDQAGLPSPPQAS